MINEFAAHLGVKTEFIVLHSVSEVLKSIKLGHGDLASAGLTMTEQKVDDDFIFGDGYFNVTQQVVCNKKLRRRLPKNLAQLQLAKLLITKDSGYADSLRMLKKVSVSKLGGTQRPNS